ILKLEKELPDLEEEKNNLNAMLVKKDAALPFLRTLEKVAGDAFCQIKIEPADISKIKFEKKAAVASKDQNTDELDTTKSQDQAKTAAEKDKKTDDLAPLKDFPAFSIEVTGRFAALVDFFEKFENMPYFVRPLIVDISPEKKKIMASGSAGAISAEKQASQESENQNEKNVIMTMIFVVYGN
ncbi:MAG: hypothetical protein PHP25_01345, partial [Candidatus Moranbacteria bacterium]|nr:hypothetical protein [Candidatus Moranbacteria bacterium]